MTQFSSALSIFALWLAGIGLTAMTAIISWQVFARYLLNSAPAWTEQAALLLMLWFVLFSAAAGVREGFHIRLSLIEQLSGPKTRKSLRLFSHLVVFFVGAMMAIEGSSLAIATWDHTIPTLGFSRSVAFWPFAGSGAMSVVFSAEHLFAEINDRKVQSLWN